MTRVAGEGAREGARWEGEERCDGAWAAATGAHGSTVAGGMGYSSRISRGSGSKGGGSFGRSCGGLRELEVQLPRDKVGDAQRGEPPARARRAWGGDAGGNLRSMAAAAESRRGPRAEFGVQQRAR